MAPAARGNVASERVDEATGPQHWWEEAQEVGGANSWGRVDTERDLEPPR